MYKASLIFSAVLMTAVMVTSFGGEASNKESSSKEVTIGKQVWMTKNLNLDEFRNGDPIPHAKTYEKWEEAGKNKQPAWCYYDNASSKGKKYGKLYNWHAVNDPRGLAPEGWHLPSDEEWKTLTDYLGFAGPKMKSNSGWEDDGNGTNESGFSGLPGGVRHSNGTFGFIGKIGGWWSSTDKGTSDAWFRSLGSSGGIVYRSDSSKGGGLSLRCLKD